MSVGSTSIETFIEAAEQVEAVVPDAEITEVVADKGHHSNQVMVDLESSRREERPHRAESRPMEVDRHPEARDAVYRDRRRIRGAPGNGSWPTASSS